MTALDTADFRRMKGKEHSVSMSPQKCYSGFKNGIIIATAVLYKGWQEMVVFFQNTEGCMKKKSSLPVECSFTLALSLFMGFTCCFVVLQKPKSFFDQVHQLWVDVCMRVLWGTMTNHDS